jgi:signal transduction histidine kinase
MKLFHRFFMILLLFALLPLAGVGVWLLASRQTVRDNARALHGRLAALTAEMCDRTLEQLNRSLLVVEDVEHAGGRPNLESVALQHAAASDSNIGLLAIIDAAGQEMARAVAPDLMGFPMDHSRDAAVARMRATGKLTLGAALAREGHTFIPAVHPLPDGRGLYLLYSLKGLSARMERMSKGRIGRLLFVDEKGSPIPGVGSPPPSLDWVLPDDGAAEGWQDHMSSPEGEWVAASARSEAVGWRAVSLQPREEAYAEDRAAFARASVFFAVLIGLVAAGAYLLAMQMLKPINALITSAERVSKGEFDRPLPRLGWGELDTLGVTFNAMSAKIRQYQAIQVERMLDEKAKVEALVGNIPGGIMLLAPDGTLLYVNDLAAGLLGARGRRPQAKLTDFTAASESARVVAQVLAGGKNAGDGVISSEGANGTQAFYACRARKVVQESREIGSLILMRDITLERELDRMKEEFFHAIVHDLRGPLGVISGALDLLKRTASLGDREKKYVDYSDQASKRLSELITNILDLAKLESGTMKANVQTTDAGVMLESVRALTQIQAEGKRISLVIEGGKGVELSCDVTLVERVITNLTGNALRFTPAGGRITIAAKAEGASEIEFSVSDTGPGIPANARDLIFEKFKQLDRDATSRMGYGIGLSICRKVVELHQGRIWVESEVGKGSRFAFRIPRKFGAAVAPPPATNSRV